MIGTNGTVYLVIVSISGIQGRHPISVGVAYWYRGHFLYGPHGNPVEPIPFATKEIHIIGTTIDTAPPYNPHSMDLEDEREIAALHRGMIREWENMLEENSIKPHTEAFAEQTTLVEGLAFKSTEGENQGEDDDIARCLSIRREIGSVRPVSFAIHYPRTYTLTMSQTHNSPYPHHEVVRLL